MKKIFSLSSMLLLFLAISGSAQDGSSRIRIEITDENGKQIEKEYQSREAMQNDPELEKLGIEMDMAGAGITVRNKGSNQRISIVQENGNNRIEIRSRGNAETQESMDQQQLPQAPLPPLEMEELAREREQMMELRDSLLSMHQEEMRERREEIQNRMEERRAAMQRRMEEHRREPVHGRQTIIIEELSEEDAARLGIKNHELQLNGLLISPDPQEEIIKIKFSAKSKKPVKILLSNQDNILLINETSNLSGKDFEKIYELEGFGNGTYFLQIIQDKNILARKIRVE